MSPEKEKVEEFIRSRTSDIDINGDLIGQDFSEEALKSFKKAMKELRSFADLMRLHRGEKALKFPEKLKKSYLIAGGLLELYYELADLESRIDDQATAIARCQSLIAAQKNEWKKAWVKGGVEKFSKDLSILDISFIPEPVLNNFLSRYITEKEGEPQQSHSSNA